jgi:hypothetical protein
VPIHLSVAQLDEHQIADLEDAGSSPAGKANYQRVGESGRPYLPWKQGIGGSNPPTLTIIRVEKPAGAARAAPRIDLHAGEGQGFATLLTRLVRMRPAESA